MKLCAKDRFCPRDCTKNIKKRSMEGMHSVEDIYFRKILAATGTGTKENLTGHLVPTKGAKPQRFVRHLFSVIKFQIALSDFVFEYFAKDQIELLDTWYKTFDRTELKLELADMVPGVNVRKVLIHLDKQILNQISAKLREG